MDIEKSDVLISYLRSEGRIGKGERPRCTPLSGGISSRAILVEHDSGEAWVVKQSLPKLRVKAEWYRSPERIHREALGIRWLVKMTPEGTVPELVFEDHEHHIMAMEAVPQPHTNWKKLLLAGRLDMDHVEQFGTLLATIHRDGYRRRDQLATVFEDRSVFESLRLEPYYRYTAERLPEVADLLTELVEDVLERRITVVHGDYSPKNVLVRDGRLVLLDHEVIHFGDPAVDLGFSMTHLLSKAHHVVPQRAAFAEATRHYWRTYRQALGELPWTAELEPRVVRHTIAFLIARVAGCSKLEYLDAAARQRQCRAACTVAADPPSRVDELVDAFIQQL